MRAWLIDGFKGIDGLRIADIPDPIPAAGEVVIDLIYSALNPADRYLAEGMYPARPPLPHVLGRDGIGTVSVVGPGVDDISVGETVSILRGDTGVNRAGTFAQRVAVAADSLVRVPQGWTQQQAAGAPLVYLTAYQAISQWTDLPEKAVVLITGASGGVGVAGVQLAKAMGHTVVGLSRDAGKSGTLSEIGATLTLNPREPNWPKQLKEMIAEKKVDLAIDNIGGDLFNQVIETLGRNGRISCVGALAGPVPQLNTATLFFRRAQIRGVSVGDYGAAGGQKAWAEIVELLDRTGARPLVDNVFNFDQLPAAFESLKKGPMGKVLLSAKNDR